MKKMGVVENRLSVCFGVSVYFCIWGYALLGVVNKYKYITLMSISDKRGGLKSEHAWLIEP